MDYFVMKPKIDFAFKEMMENEDARKGFLSAVLKIAPEDIKETRILNPYLRKVHEDDKLGILDVRVLLNNDTEIDIEINLNRFDAWPKRSLFYVAKMYTGQINPGDSYNKLNKCINISILDFKLFPEEPDCYSCFHLWEDTRHFLYTDRIEFHLLELPKLSAELKEDSSNILLWAKFINAERKEEFDMIAERNPYIKSAYDQLQIISQDRQKRMEYEAREKAIRDYSQGMYEAERRGKEEGIKEGRAKEIIESGYDFGLSEQDILGRLQKKLQITLEQAEEYMKMFGSQTA